MEVIDGRAVSKARRAELKNRVAAFEKTHGIAPGLAVVLVGSDPASQVYVKGKIKAFEEVGLRSIHHEISAETSQSELDELIEKLNHDETVHGILVQFPLPEGLSQESVLERISPLKDADGLTFENLGRLCAGELRVAPCTPFGVMALLEAQGVELSGQRAVVVGRSRLVGKPMAQLLEQANATVSVCHSRTKDLREYTTKADIVVVAAGRPRFLGKEDFKEGAVVIDVGIHRQEGSKKLCGDVRYEELEGWARAATPVPGGVGPMTITMLLENTLKLAEWQLSPSTPKNK